MKGTALLKLTVDDMKNMGILMGPCKVLAERIAACLPRRRPRADSRWGPQRSTSGGVPWVTGEV